MSQNILTVTLSKRRTVKVLVILSVERISRMQMKLSNRFFCVCFLKVSFILIFLYLLFRMRNRPEKDLSVANFQHFFCLQSKSQAVILQLPSLSYITKYKTKNMGQLPYIITQNYQNKGLPNSLYHQEQLDGTECKN